jgi:Flp pilus assembly secretin CpaC
MGNINLHISRSQVLIVTAAAVVLWVGGCGDPFGEKTAGLQSDKIIRDVGNVKPRPEPNIPIPEIYKAPPRIVEQVVGGKPEWKLFYFCKYHTSEELKTIINAQFATQLFDEKGKSTSVTDYTVSSNPATNQLIVRCPLKADVDAVLETLQEVDVPPIQVKIDCIISEVYADKTLDRSTTLAIKDLFGEDIQLMPAGQKFNGGGALSGWLTEAQDLPAFPGAALREFDRAKMGLKIGYGTGHFLALVDLLESKGYLKILMNPTLEVVNGKSAMVSSSQHVPLQQVSVAFNIAVPYAETRTEYVDVVDSLKITPHVFADGFIGLETDILLGSKLTPEGVKQMPIITKKEIENKENRIRQGESLVIGGMRKTERRDVVRGVPGLKDIPLLGALFSGRDFEERAVETIFILTPTISTGGVPKTELAEEIKGKHEAPTPTSGTDIFGLDAREKDLQKKGLEAEEARLQADAEKTSARSAIRAADERVQLAQAEVRRARTELSRIQAELEKIKAEADVKTKAAEAAKVAADKTAADAAAAKAAADKIAADATKSKEESDKAKAEAEAKAKTAEAAKAVADKAAADAAAATTEAQRITADARKLKAEAEKLIVEAEAKVKAAEQAKQEAEKSAAEQPVKVEPDKTKEEAAKAADKPKEEPPKPPAEENKTGA